MSFRVKRVHENDSLFAFIDLLGTKVFSEKK